MLRPIAALLAYLLAFGPLYPAAAIAQSLSSPYSISLYKSQVFTATGQTGPVIPLNGLTSGSSLVGSSFASASITVVGNALSSVTFAVQGSADNGGTYYPLLITQQNATGATPALTATVTANGVYQVSLAGMTHIRIVTSGTFNAAAVTFSVAASPNAQAGTRNGGSGTVTASAVAAAIQPQNGCQNAGWSWVPQSNSCVAPGSGSVTSFNSRSGAVTLAAVDVNAVGPITNNTTGTAAIANSVPAAGLTGNALPSGVTTAPGLNLPASQVTGLASVATSASASDLNAGTLSAARLPGTISSNTTGSAASVPAAGITGTALPSTITSAPGLPFVNRSGDTMTGTLTSPNLISQLYNVLFVQNTSTVAGQIGGGIYSSFPNALGLTSIGPDNTTPGSIRLGTFARNNMGISVSSLFLEGTQLTSSVPVNLPGNPVNPLQATPKQYVDAAVAGSVTPANVTGVRCSSGSATTDFACTGSQLSNAIGVTPVQNANVIPGSGLLGYLRNTSRINAFGDSISVGWNTAGDGVAIQNSHFWMTAKRNSLDLGLWGISGDQACDIFPRQIFPVTKGGLDLYSAQSPPAVGVAIGTNDTNVKGVGAYEAVFNACHQMVLSYEATPSDYRSLTPSSVTGSCVSVTAGSSCSGTGTLVYTLTTYGKSIYLWANFNDTASSAATYTYSVDGGSQSTTHFVRTASEFTVPISTQNGTISSYQLLRILGVAAGQHTITVTSGSTGGTQILGVGTLPTSNIYPGTPMFVTDIPTQLVTNPVSTTAAQLQYTSDITSNIALINSDGADIRLNATRNCMRGTSSEMVDQLHPNVFGQNELSVCDQLSLQPSPINRASPKLLAINTSYTMYDLSDDITVFLTGTGSSQAITLPQLPTYAPGNDGDLMPSKRVTIAAFGNTANGVVSAASGNSLYVLGNVAAQPNITVPTGGSVTFSSYRVAGSNSSNWLLTNRIGAAYTGSVGTVASATALTVPNSVVHVTGTAAIGSISPTFGCTTVGISCRITLIPDGAFTLSNTGGTQSSTSYTFIFNSTAVVGRAMDLTCEPSKKNCFQSY